METFMKKAFIATFCLLLSSSPFAQKANELDRAADAFKSGLSDSMKQDVRSGLKDAGTSDAVVDVILAQATEEYADCAVSKALEQAGAQNLPKEVLIRGLIGESLSDKQLQELRKFDNESFDARLQMCRDEFRANVGAESD